MLSTDEKRKEFFVMSAGALFYVFVLLLCTRTLTSGYHLLDDHEIIRSAARFQSGAYTWKTIFQKGLLTYFDSGIRFRPLYLTLRMLRVYVLGTNYVAWSILVGAEIVLCILSAYYIMRNMKVNGVLSALTAALIVTGDQGEIWWRLGPQEPTGLLLFLLCMLFIQRYEKIPKLRTAVCIIILGFLTAASKESFTLLLPVLVIFGIGYDLWLNEDGLFWKKVGASIYKNKLIILLFAVNFCINMYVIIFKIGVLSVEYAGIDVSQGVAGYINMIGRMLSESNMRVYILLCAGALVLGLISLVQKGQKGIKNFLRKNGILLLSFLGISAAELILYARSGMFGRYFVPYTAGVCFFSTVLISEKVEKRIYKQIYAVIALALTAVSYYTVWNGGIVFTQQGKALEEGFKVIEDTFQLEDMVVTCMDGGGELDYSFTQYLKIELGMKNVYTWNEENGFSALYLENEKEIEGLSDADCLILPGDKGLKDFGLSDEEFLFMENNIYGDIYQRKNRSNL